MPRQDRVDEALEKVHRTCAANGVAQKEWLEALQAKAADETMLFILEVCLRYGIRPEELLIEIAQAESGF